MQRGVGYMAAGLLALVVASCGGGGGGAHASGGSGGRSACSLVSRLDSVALGVRTARVDDPVAWKHTLDDAVTRYRDTLRELRVVAPASLAPALERVDADVTQYRFDAARTDRVALDEYAQRECGRPLPGAAPTTPTSGP